MQEQNQIKLMIENSLKFAKALRSNVLETEHLLFGVLSIQDSLPSKILGMFLSYQNYNKLLMYERFGFPILMILSLTGVLGKILGFFITPLYNLWYMAFTGLVSILL